MSRIISNLFFLLLPFGFVTPAQSSDDAFRFFAEEARLGGASRIPMTRKEAPATVYVVTARDIKDSGAQTIWDALRGVPGVDVAQTKANQGEVSIRGLNKAWNNRTLVLLNGRTMLNTATDLAIWESIPVTMQEIDRIEVVEGPASAVYGPNAINGVINIVTKSPEKFQGGLISYTGGERNYQATSFDSGRKLDKWSYRVGGGWRGMDKFERADESASKAGKVNFFTEYAPEPDRSLSVSGGLTDMNTQTSADRTGDFFYRSKDGFLDAVYRHSRTKYGLYYKGSRVHLDDFAALANASMDSDAYFGEVEQTVSLPYNNEMVAGTNYQRNTARSTAFTNRKSQDLWAAYFEDKWEISDRWSLQAGGRVDRHPYTSYMFSPRGSLVFTPAAEQVFRLSAGTSYKNPTMLENSVDTVVTGPADPPYTSVAVRTRGNKELRPDRMKTVELAHTGRFGPVTARAAGFYYKLRNRIDVSAIQYIGVTGTTLDALSTYAAVTDIQAWGGEFGLELRLSPLFSSYANYSYQRLKDLPGGQFVSSQSPLNKINAGLRVKRDGWTGDLQAHWVDKTRWRGSMNDAPVSSSLLPVGSYLLVNAHAGYVFKGRLNGLEAGVSATNLLNDEHYEAYRQLNSLQPAQSAEILRARWTGTVSYRF